MDSDLTPPTAGRRSALIVAGVALALLLPFVAKPFHVDDPMYLWAARQIAAHPLHPYAIDVNWDGRTQPMPRVMQNPPGVCYLLAAASAVVGWGEVGLHLAMLPVAVLAVVGTHRLARRFGCPRPAVAAALLLVCPGFLVSATTLMCEVPMLALWVWAVWLWDRGSTAGHPWPWLVGAGLTVAAAVLTKYPAVNLIPLLAAHAVLLPAPRRARLAQAVGLVLPIAILVAYDRATAPPHGHGLLSDAILFSRRATAQNPVPLAGRTLDALCFVGGGGLAVAAAFVRTGKRWLTAAALAAAFAVAARVWFSVPPAWASPWPFFAQAGVLAAAGVAVLAACVAGVGSTDRRRPLFLLLWAAGVFAFAAFVNWSTNTRSVVPLLPAACILAARATARLPRWPIAFAAVVALVAAVADYRFAADNRAAAEQIAARLSPAGGPRPAVWFGGHWGFQWYMARAGGRPLDADHPDYRPGDYVVLPLDNYGTRPVAAPLVTLDTFVVGPDGPWTSTMTLSAGAGFYFSPGDRLPFVFGPVPPQAYRIDRVGPDRRPR